MIWIGNFFIKLDVDKELFWTDRKQGGRLYHLFNVGMYDMGHINKGCKALSITIPFASLKLGYNPKAIGNNNTN